MAGNIIYNSQPLTYNSQNLTYGGASNDGGGNSTFGLPADVVALIESRFGTVANYLRLRNQGQV